MRVHHLNCGTMRPPGLREPLVDHVLLLETPRGLALVDSGFGTLDLAMPGRRIGPMRHLIRPALDAEETAIAQIRELGHDPRDVRDVVLTHFDADHVGGLADFPWARVHLTAAEAFAAHHPQVLLERQRYRRAQRDHGPQLVEHAPAEGDTWRGFAAATELSDVAPGVVLLSLPGHTRGHAAVAVDAGDHWVLHAGDAFYHRGQVTGSHPVPRALLAMERSVAFDWARVRANHERLREVATGALPGVVLVNSHDPHLLARMVRDLPGT